MEVYITELCEEWKIKHLRNPKILDVFDNSLVATLKQEPDLEGLYWKGEPFFPVGNTENIGMVVLDTKTQTRVYFLKKGDKIFLLFSCDKTVMKIDDKFVFTIPEIDKMFHTRKYEPFSNSHILSKS